MLSPLEKTSFFSWLPVEKNGLENFSII